MMNIDANALKRFQSRFPSPPEQGPVGAAPYHYFKDIPGLKSNQIIQESIKKLPEEGRKQLTRAEVVKICRNSDLHPLVAYAVVMAWGGRNFSNYRLSLESSSALESVITELRNSSRSRKDDFACAQKACSSIKGLKISFYTKLLYFLRPKQDAYILDQWTARSTAFLFPEGKIKITDQGFPSPKTEAEDYDWFCCRLDELAQIMGDGWENGEAVERALFDRRSGKWRAEIPNLPGEDLAQAQPARVMDPSSVPSNQIGGVENYGGENHNRKVNLAYKIANFYNEQAAQNDGMDLPSMCATVQCGTKTQETRVHCRYTNGVTWQFKVGARDAYTQIFFREEKGLSAYQELGFQRSGKPTEHVNGKRFPGSNAQIEDWLDNVRPLVESMSELWKTHGEGLP
jgi:hypothetical protein